MPVDQQTKPRIVKKGVAKTVGSHTCTALVFNGPGSATTQAHRIYTSQQIITIIDAVAPWAFKAPVMQMVITCHPIHPFSMAVVA